MAIVPDDKDWTWVLTSACPECGYCGADVSSADIGPGLRANARRWRELLDHQKASVRPDPATWSATEYACHVRDVFRRFGGRLDALLTQDDPQFENWDQDATALELRYDQQQPADVLDDLEAAGEAIAAAFEAVRPDQWDRPGRRSDGAVFTVATLGQYLLHDPEHHVWDLAQGYARGS